MEQPQARIFSKRDFPGGSVVNTPHFHSREWGGEQHGSNPGGGTKMPQSIQCGLKKFFFPKEAKQTNPKQ